MSVPNSFAFSMLLSEAIDPEQSRRTPRKRSVT